MGEINPRDEHHKMLAKAVVKIHSDYNFAKGSHIIMPVLAKIWVRILAMSMHGDVGSS